MEKFEPAKLIAFSLPSGELLPGFLIPVFELADQQVVQGIDDDGMVRTLYPLSASDPVLDLKTLHTTLGIELSAIEGQTIQGGNAIHAFFDNQRIYVGKKTTLALIFSECMPRIIEKLKDFPICLAGLHDFVGEHLVANQLRRSRSADFLISSTRADRQFTLVRKDDSLHGRNTLGLRERTVTQLAMTSSFADDAVDFAELVSRRKEQYISAASKPLYAEAA
jgi:hypothetical protein